MQPSTAPRRGGPLTRPDGPDEMRQEVMGADVYSASRKAAVIPLRGSGETVTRATKSGAMAQ